LIKRSQRKDPPSGESNLQITVLFFTLYLSAVLYVFFPQKFHSLAQTNVMSVCISYIMKISPITFQRHGAATQALRNRLLSRIFFSWHTAISLPTNKWFMSADRIYRMCLYGLHFLTAVSGAVVTYGFFLGRDRNNWFTWKNWNTSNTRRSHENKNVVFWKKVLIALERNSILCLCLIGNRLCKAHNVTDPITQLRDYLLSCAMFQFSRVQDST